MVQKTTPAKILTNKALTLKSKKHISKVYVEVK